MLHKKRPFQMLKPQPKLFEGLRANDLEGLVSKTFTVDQYKSKMGEDKDIVVLGFRVDDKYPAIDLMEFIEKGYKFILDADMSTGEEKDGKYQVFVELERTKKLPKQIKDLLEGISQLCDCWDWDFKYHKEGSAVTADENSIMEHIPMTPGDYENKILEYRNDELEEFFDQGAIDEVLLDDQNNITFKKTFSESMVLKLMSIGDYDVVKDRLPGHIQLDESSRNQTVYLEKYLGNYEIHKINEHFLIRNGKRAVIVRKDRW
jgi:hypothetical protein